MGQSRLRGQRVREAIVSNPDSTDLHGDAVLQLFDQFLLAGHTFAYFTMDIPNRGKRSIVSAFTSGSPNHHPVFYRHFGVAR
jgi:hypothetical protein